LLVFQKLGIRVDARKKIEAFAHATFDGAMQAECMSSEESCDESPSTTAAIGVKEKTFIVRGIPWRSTRLLKFFSSLDEDDKMDKGLRPKRGSARKNRDDGPPKDGFHIPPKGVATWMVSRRWLHDMQLSHPDLLDLIKDLILDPPGFDWSKFDAMGYESDDELDPMGSVLRLVHPPYSSLPSHEGASTTSYSLQHALRDVL
jgi:hypothetical protein